MCLFNLLYVEPQPKPHERGQLHQEHVPGKVVQGVGDDDGPDGHGGLGMGKKINEIISFPFITSVFFTRMSLQGTLSFLFSLCSSFMWDPAMKSRSSYKKMKCDELCQFRHTIRASS